MKKLFPIRFLIAGLIAAMMIFPGCTPKDSQNSTSESGHHEGDGHVHGGGHADLHQPIYNEVVAFFPGHTYALEITAKEESGEVLGYLTDPHFQPTKTDTQEILLTFRASNPQLSYTLKRKADEEGKPAIFTLTDSKLAETLCDGWEGEATASLKVNGKDFETRLEKRSASHHHEHDGHAH
jgi:hypothetical protein